MSAQPQRVTETFTPECPPPFGDWPAVYALRCFGTCCEPEIADGSNLIIDRQASIAAGDFVAIWSLGKSGTIKAVVNRLVID